MASEAEAEPRRTFTLLDAMILVAAIAPGFALSRIIVDQQGSPIVADHPARTALNAATFGISVATPVALTLTPALLLLRLRRPRPPRRRLWHTQGALNIAALSAVTPITGVALWALLALGVPFASDPFDFEVIETVLLLLPMTLAPTAIAVSICGRLLGVHGRPPDWLDRLGQRWGWFWVAFAPIDFWAILQ
ncbi:hypothetical protein [Tautonia plasticadhaerens]|uniref:Uncharacterized protein n=1 Tax=Tautonia plasticadhaerens TaxID=2527974 RepID=A0A518GZZ9_9BACT|nr:hypothetical protein [Tautonia plasticadhaerens]QDV34163.1 hypothetical protein ElP_20460 [Tautonia plasticadhaerens]